MGDYNYSLDFKVININFHYPIRNKMFIDENPHINPEFVWIDWSLERRKRLREKIKESSEDKKFELANHINLNINPSCLPAR